jgi:phytoene desaturase
MSLPTPLHPAGPPAPRRAPKVVVIGAGLGGLAVALRLQGAGHDVTVLEQREAPGGRASQLRTDGFTWDTGPSLITMPWVLEEAFAAGGMDLHSEVRMRRLEPLYRIRWAGEERHFDFQSDRDALREQIARFDARDATQLDGFLAALKPIYEEGILGAGRRAFASFGSFAPLLPKMARLGAVVPLHRFVARWFRHPRVQEAFSFHSLFIGGDPFRVPAIYAALAYLQVVDGGWYTDGGVFSLVEAMARPLDVREGAKVVQIERGASGVKAVRLEGGERIPADIVVSNADVLRTHELVGGRAPLRKLRPTMSCFLLYLGLDRVQPSLLHHTLLVGTGYRDFIRTVTKGGSGLPRTYSTYVHAPTRTEAAMAPPGGDSLAILLPVPNLRTRVEWERAADGLRDAVVADMETTFGMTGLDASVQVEHRMSPPDFAREFGAVDGNAFAVEPTLHQSAYFRTPNRVGGIPGLYHVGAGTHPGAGIPGVLLGAEVTAGLVTADVGVRR